MAIFNSYVNVYQRVMAGWLTFHGTSENIPPKNDQTLDDLGTHRLATQIGHQKKVGQIRLDFFGDFRSGPQKKMAKNVVSIPGIPGIEEGFDQPGG